MSSSRIKQPNSFAERFRQAFKGARDAEIARQLGYKSQSPLTKFMSGEALPTGELLLRIAQVTKCNLHWLLTGEHDPTLVGNMLGPELMKVLEEICEAHKTPMEVLMRSIVPQALRQRLVALTQRVVDPEYPLGPDELREYQILTQFFADNNGKEKSKRSPRFG
jgi:transcriptional regulator with XRE-family HTH domain